MSLMLPGRHCLKSSILPRSKRSAHCQQSPHLIVLLTRNQAQSLPTSRTDQVFTGRTEESTILTHRGKDHPSSCTTIQRSVCCSSGRSSSSRLDVALSCSDTAWRGRFGVACAVRPTDVGALCILLTVRKHVSNRQSNY